MRPAPARRTRKMRGAPVVRRTLDATLDELARTGYGALRIDEVARRANVNKTTVYRRWPTKEALVRAAFVSLAEPNGPVLAPDTGTLAGDLRALIEQKMRFARSTRGAAMIRLLDESACDAEVIAIVRSLRAARDVMVRAILERARVRGELRRDVDLALFMTVMELTCDQARKNAHRVDARFVQSLVDLLLRGAAPVRRDSNSKLRSARK